MKRIKTLSLLLILLGAILNGMAWGHGRGGYDRYHSHPGFSFYYGPSYARPFYPYPYIPYYPPAIVTVPVSPPIYIERSGARQAPNYQSNYWYYCDNPQGYYPYIKECPAGWIQVPPVPQSPN